MKTICKNCAMWLDDIKDDERTTPQTQGYCAMLDLYTFTQPSDSCNEFIHKQPKTNL